MDTPPPVNATPETATCAAPEFMGSATYSPEDNKLRLYVGRVPRSDYDRLRAEGWTSTPKQGCDFVATWTPTRRDTALEFAGVIDDEDQGPAERAAERAERFGGYRDKRTDDATGRADKFDAMPAAHGFQSPARAERAVARHDRHAARAVDFWSKAEYWTRRTAGVISHALHVSTPAVRMGRIKTLEAELRKLLAGFESCAARFRDWQKIAAILDPAAQTLAARQFAGGDGAGYWDKYKNPRTGREGSLWDLLRDDAADSITGAEACALYLARHIAPDSPKWEETTSADWKRHLEFRLAYENQMIDAQGGRAGVVEMVPGGWLRSGNRYSGRGGVQEERRIMKVNKSPVSGRVVSVLVRENHRSTVDHWGNPYPDGVTKILLHTVEVERMAPDAYRAPTAEELAAYLDGEKAAKKAAKASAPAAVPLVNPTDADAERLQAVWNASGSYKNRPDEKKTVLKMSQAAYSARSAGSYSHFKPVAITGGGNEEDTGGHMGKRDLPALAKVRSYFGQVVVLNDKPQKALPAAVWHDPRPGMRDELAKELPALVAAVGEAQGKLLPREGTPARELLERAAMLGLVSIRSLSQIGWTAAGWEWQKQNAPTAETVNA